MGSHNNQTTFQKQKGTQTLDEVVTGINQYQKKFDTGYNNLGQEFAKRISQPLNLQYFNGFSNNLDPIVQNTMARGIQNLKAAQAGANSELANRLAVTGTGDNSALLAAMQRMSGIANAGNQNALIPQALEQQRAFDVQKQQLIDASNQLKLGARAQSINELSPGLNLLQLLNQMAGTSAGRRTTQTTDMTNRGFNNTSKEYF